MSKEGIQYLLDNRNDLRGDGDDAACEWIEIMMNNIDELLNYAEAGMNPTVTAAALGRKGGLKGGVARAGKLTPERRAEIARVAAAARWGK